MFVGHLGVGLALKKVDSRINLGYLFFAAMFSDVLLWILVLTNTEKVIIPSDYTDTHFLNFSFPYSHGLMASLVWSALFFILTRLLIKRTSAAIAVSLAVFSHFLLDFIVHIPELPVMGNNSRMLGLGLWKNMTLALLLELVLLMVGLFIYSKATRAINFIGKYGLTIFLILITALAFGGQLFAPVPQGVNQLAISSLITLIIAFIISAWLDAKRSAMI
jgi:hypothetical protein